jgi:iron complex transport system permease protein
MRDTVNTAAPATSPHAPENPRRDRLVAVRIVGLLVCFAVLSLVLLLSVAVGSNPLPLSAVLNGLLHLGSGIDQTVVWGLRVPRTLIGLLAGVALGLAGALMQALTRNPLADPGLLGVNSGASSAIVIGIGLFGLASPAQYIWLSFLGAAFVSAAVYVLGSRARGGATPVRLTLAGIALTAACTAFIQGVLLLEPEVFDVFRFWQIGSLAGRNLTVFWQTAPFALVGGIVALALARPLNALALGDDVGRSLGAHPTRTRTAAAFAITLLCGAATAAVGPISFIGLAVPHIGRAIAGPDQRWVLPYSALLAPTLLLAADVLGRVVVRPGELQVGITTAFLGAPVLIALARRRRVTPL